ncbi:MAG: hypothetical protein KDA87_15180 [Planctomycetales bacterium]|nr:hypothetical protein [Planctomycetales bacterium]
MILRLPFIALVAFVTASIALDIIHSVEVRTRGQVWGIDSRAQVVPLQQTPDGYSFPGPAGNYTALVIEDGQRITRPITLGGDGPPVPPGPGPAPTPGPLDMGDVAADALETVPESAAISAMLGPWCHAIHAFARPPPAIHPIV